MVEKPETLRLKAIEYLEMAQRSRNADTAAAFRWLAADYLGRAAVMERNAAASEADGAC